MFAVARSIFKGFVDLQELTATIEPWHHKKVATPSPGTAPHSAGRDGRLWLSQTREFPLQYVEEQGRMEDVDLAEIAAKIGTPTYVYSKSHITQQYQAVAHAFQKMRPLIAYAVKANSAKPVLTHLAKLGAGADIVSGGELMRALAAGFAPQKIVFSGVGKLDEEIDAALQAEVCALNVESVEELTRIAVRAEKLDSQARVMLRVNPEVDVRTHAYLATGLYDSKFGIALGEVPQILQLLKGFSRVQLVGFACHIGSQIHELAPYITALRSVVDQWVHARAMGFPVEYLDVGGGFAIPYSPDAEGMDVAGLAAGLLPELRDLPLQLILEPGRYLVGNAGILLTRVIGRKVNAARRFVIVDAAMNDLLRPALYGAVHGVVPVKGGAEQSWEPVDVVGPVCECGDFLAHDALLPAVEMGDLLAIMSAGAYGMVMASNYNSRSLPAEVWVHGQSFELSRPRERLEELVLL